jgi:hypothetical protein
MSYFTRSSLGAHGGKPGAGVCAPASAQNMRTGITSRISVMQYRLYAAQNVDWSMWNNPDFINQIQPGGTEVEAHEKDRVHVQLKPIKNEETDRAREKAGLR